MDFKKIEIIERSSSLSVGDFIKEKPFLVFHLQDTLYDIVNEMRETHNYAALITDKNKLVGIVTEHRIFLYLLSWLSEHFQSVERLTNAFNVLKAGDIMITNPFTINSETSIEDAFQEVTEKGFHYMPVVENNVPVGILDRVEISHYMVEKDRKELESKDMILSYLMHHENYGCL